MYQREITSGHSIVEMAVVSHNAGLEMLGIGTVAQHMQVIVGLDDYSVGQTHIVVHSRRYAAQVGGHSDGAVTVGDVKAGVVRPVVHHLERCDFKSSDFERKFLVYRSVIVLDAARDIMAA